MDRSGRGAVSPPAVSLRTNDTRVQVGLATGRRVGSFGEARNRRVGIAHLAQKCRTMIGGHRPASKQQVGWPSPTLLRSAGR